MNFRELVDQKAGYKNKTRKPRSMTLMADKCGVSRQHLYNLFNGSKTPPAWTVARIAKGLGVSVLSVHSALKKSREEGLSWD